VTEPAGRVGRADHASRGRLDRARVVAAALAVVDRDGLDGLTMRTLGRELGVDPMAAYHHLPGKAAILQGVAEAILAEIPPPAPGVVMAWPDAVRLVAREHRRALLAHPNALPIVATQPMLTPAGLRFAESAARLLVRGGLTPAEAVRVIDLVAVVVIGSALVEARVTPASDALPALGRTPAADAELRDPDARFEDLLEVLVRGLEVVLSERRAGGRGRPAPGAVS
jgi:TetR/AcrR family transcriptional regulator, tetracycline repressor protein